MPPPPSVRRQLQVAERVDQRAEALRRQHARSQQQRQQHKQPVIKQPPVIIKQPVAAYELYTDAPSSSSSFPSPSVLPLSFSLSSTTSGPAFPMAEYQACVSTLTCLLAELRKDVGLLATVAHGSAIAPRAEIFDDMARLIRALSFGLDGTLEPGDAQPVALLRENERLRQLTRTLHADATAAAQRADAAEARAEASERRAAGLQAEKTRLEQVPERKKEKRKKKKKRKKKREKGEEERGGGNKGDMLKGAK